MSDLKSEELFYRKRCKRLALALGLSAFLNISILAFGIYEWQETGFSYLATSSFRPQKLKLYRQEGKELSTLTQNFRELELLDFDGLLLVLDDTTLVAGGYKRQDLALSMLVKRHYFDLKRALGADVAVKRLFTYMPQDEVRSEIELYPDLSQDELAQVREFAKREKWPCTTEGLLAQYRKQENPELKDVILLTDEYRVLELLLTRGTPISRDAIFDLATRVEYELMKKLHTDMAKSQDFSPEVRRGFLLRALPHSATILYQVDPRFCVHSLADKPALLVLNELSKNPEMAKEYALALLEAPRSSVIWKRAIGMLCETKQLDPQSQSRDSILESYGRLPPKPKPETKSETKPEIKTQTKLEPKTASKAPLKPLAKPVTKPVTKQVTKPALKPATKPAIKPQKAEIVYIVQSGDTLWHISKRFNVDIDKLKKHNKLTTDALKPGSMLRIPQEQDKKGS